MNIIELAKQFIVENNQLIVNMEDSDNQSDEYQAAANAAIKDWIKSGPDLSDYTDIKQDCLFDKIRSDFDYVLTKL